MKERLVTSLTVLLLAGLFVVSLPLASPAQQAADSSQQQEIVEKARLTFQSFMRDEKMSWLQQNISEAKALLIIPSILKGGFIVGGSGGSGVLVVKDPETGLWTHPGFYTIGSVSFGLQIGGEAAEVIMLVRTGRALTNLYTSSLKLGGDVSVTAGPVGMGAKSAIVADIVSFARSKGVYAGLSLEGALIKIRNEWNEIYYGQPVTPVDIFVKQEVENLGAQDLIRAVSAAD